MQPRELNHNWACARRLDMEAVEFLLGGEGIERVGGMVLQNGGRRDGIYLVHKSGDSVGCKVWFKKIWPDLVGFSRIRSGSSGFAAFGK